MSFDHIVELHRLEDGNALRMVSKLSSGHDLITRKSQQSFGSKDRVETKGQMDGRDCITSLTNAVGKKRSKNFDKRKFCAAVKIMAKQSTTGSKLLYICLLYTSPSPRDS